MPPTMSEMPAESDPRGLSTQVSVIAANLHRVQERVRAACERAGRSPDEVTIIGISKGFPASAVVAAYEAGLSDIGENRVQEAAGKVEAATAQGARPRWHLVGHLQSNKVKTALGLFDIIHSVDSLRLAEVVSRQARAFVPVLLEVNVAGEESKFGFRPDEVPGALAGARALPNVDVQGLMTVAPLAEDAEDVRPVFRRLRELGESLGLRQLSMGMSDDFEVAVEEGATLVRIGRAIFGPRPDPFPTARPGTQ
jgi:pyridoxal phosphate enzyme (YggS family)